MTGTARLSGRELFERARLVPITDLLAELGVELRRVAGGYRSRMCPFCGEGSRSSVRFAVDVENNLFFCHVCQTGGDGIKLFELAYGLTPLEAAKKVLKMDDDGTPSRNIVKLERARLRKEAEKQKAATQAMKTRIFTRLLKFIYQMKKSDIEGSLAYMTNERKIPLEVIREAWKMRLIGFLPDDVRRTEAWLRQQFKAEELIQAGLLKEGSKRIGIAFRKIVTPYYAEDRTVPSMEFRYAESKHVFGPKSIRHGTAPKPWIWEGSGYTAVITEGIMDALSLRAFGFKGTVVCTPGISQWQNEWDEIVAGRHVIVIFDNDAEPLKNKDGSILLDEDGSPVYPGPSAARRLVRRFERDTACLSAKMLLPKRKGEDINDILRRMKL